MSLQWTLVASFLYIELFVVSLLVLPIASPTRWQKFFKSRFLQSLGHQTYKFFYLLTITLVLFLLDAIREIYKYNHHGERSGEYSQLSLELQANLKLFRAQRNFYISGFSLFLSFVIRRLVTLISAQATLLAQNEAAMRQAQSASSTARSLLSQKSDGESAQNDSNEAHDKVVSQLKAQIKELQAKELELQNQLAKEKKDKEALKSQADSLAKEYDRLSEEHAKTSCASGDKKSD